MRNLLIPTASALALAATACNSGGTTRSCGPDQKCDGFDLDEKDVPPSPCDGILFDKSGRGLGNGKIAGRLGDPLARLVLQSGSDCPTAFEDIVTKLKDSSPVDSTECFADDIRTAVVSETAQALDEVTNYRSVSMVDCDQDGAFGSDVLFSLFGIAPGRSLPENVEIIAFDASEGVFNYYETTSGGEINFFGTSSDLLGGPGAGDDRRCARCHTGGGLVMKELAAPWLHWEGDTTTPGAQELVDEHSEFLGFRSDGIELEDVVRSGNDRWNQTRADRLLALGDTREILRPLFCGTEVNLESASSSPQSTDIGDVSFFPLAGTVFDTQLGFGSISGSGSEAYDALIRENGQRLDGLPSGNIETVFGLTTVVPSASDRSYISELIDRNILDEGLVDDILMVDFTRAVFSDDRCGLLDIVPGIPADDLMPELIREELIAALGSPSPGTPEAELLANLQNDVDHRAQVDSFKQACSDRMSDTVDIGGVDVPEALIDYMKVVSLNRDRARELEVFEFPQTMPSDDQSVASGTRLHPTSCEATTEFVAIAQSAGGGSDCSHGICEEGGALSSTCEDPEFPGDCVAQVCADDPFCCDTSWNEFCVEKVESICGETCEKQACCRTCGPSSQACGNSCIALGNTCNQPPGCACDG